MGAPLLIVRCEKWGLCVAMLLGVGVNLEDAERVSFRIDEVSLPASIGNREFWQGDNAAKLLDDSSGCVEVLDFKRADKRIRAALRWWRLRRTLQQSTTRTAGLDCPVRDRKPLYLTEFPAEYL